MTDRRSRMWVRDKYELFRLGVGRVGTFCKLNRIPAPAITAVPAGEWEYPGYTCAYYRPRTGIRICLDECQTPAPEVMCRNWTWPGSTVDREPFGVLCHELGHHCDWRASTVKSAYFGNYGSGVREESGEKPLTGYCDGDEEWFAEVFRLFVSNPPLLEQVRPRTYAVLIKRWVPVPSGSWLENLGANVPDRIVKSLVNKGARK